MRTRRRKNVLWALVAIAVVLTSLLRAMDIVPDGPYDLFARSWPALLILVGLSVLLRDRVPMANLATILITVVLTVAVAVLAYSSRSAKESDAQDLPIVRAIGESITLLAINLNTLDTDVEITPALGVESEITGNFIGSVQSDVVSEYTESENGIGEFTLTESKPSALPMLEEVGRGSVVLRIPPDLAVAVALTAEDGDVLLDLTSLSLERLNIEVSRGDVEVRLPEYEPLSPNAAEQPGQLVVENGDLTIYAPEAIDVRLEFDRRGNDVDPQFPPTYIEVRDPVDGMLRRDQETAGILSLYRVVIPRGLLSLQLLPVE